MAGIPSRMNQSAREQVLSTDLNRIGNLHGRELMDAAQGRNVRADFYNPATNTFDDFSAAAKTGNAMPLSGTTKPPSLEGIAFTFNMALGAGEAYLPATPGANPDISGNQLLRWAAQTVTWPGGGIPDATNPKICLIVATPGDVLSDVESRNILLDPSTRTVSPQNVYKTSNPVATISVVAGTAASAPLPPATPAGTLVLFQVWVPALASDSTGFFPSRQAWRNIEFPGSSQHGILKGCIPSLTGGITGAVDQLTSIDNRIVIDGELLSFRYGAPITADTVSPPTAAPVNNDKPYYLYLCGGRHAQVSNPITIGGVVYAVSPVYCVLSATPPDALGYPSAALAIASPVIAFPIAACCYIGVCFFKKNTTDIVPVYYEGDWVRVASMYNLEQPDVTAAAAVYTAIPMPTLPAVATAMRVRLFITGASSTLLRISISAADAGNITVLGTAAPLAEQWVDAVAQANLYYKDLVSTDHLVVRVVGCNMNVPRLAR